jgi:hypothetical protein
MAQIAGRIIVTGRVCEWRMNRLKDKILGSLRFWERSMKPMQRASFWILTMLGSLLLLTVVQKFWRPGSGRVELGGIGICVVGIWAMCLQHQRTLSLLKGQIEEKALDRLFGTADSIAMFGYLILLLALIH